VAVLEVSDPDKSINSRWKVLIIKDGSSFEKISKIPLNDICLTAPAITNGLMCFRAQKYLIAAGDNQKTR
jgi:hypothetical protein